MDHSILAQVSLSTCICTHQIGMVDAYMFIVYFKLNYISTYLEGRLKPWIIERNNMKTQGLSWDTFDQHQIGAL